MRRGEYLCFRDTASRTGWPDVRYVKLFVSELPSGVRIARLQGSQTIPTRSGSCRLASMNDNLLAAARTQSEKFNPALTLLPTSAGKIWQTSEADDARRPSYKYCK